MSELRFRLSREGDVPALQRLWAEVFGDSEEFTGEFFRLLWRPEYCRVAESAGEIAAMGFCIPGAVARGARCSYIYAMATAERYRGLGAAREIGLRLIADAFASGADIHTQTAAQVFGMPPEYVTSQMRSRAKAVNFGIVYGIGAYSLSKDIGVTVAEANAYINGYLRTYHGVRQYMEDTKQFAKDHGYVKTLFGRRRDLPEMSATNRITKAFGERVAMNTPIQGTAADIIKIAMVRVYRRLQAEGLKSRLILQVHDELIVETTPDEIDTVKALVQQEMSGAAELSVPLVVDVGVGKTWYEAK